MSNNSKNEFYDGDSERSNEVFRNRSTLETSPPFRLTFEQRDGYVRVAVSAQTLTLQAVLEFLSEISLKCAEMRMNRVMLIRDIPVPPPLPTGVDAWNHYFKMSTGSVIALVNPHPAITAEIQKAIDFDNENGAKIKYFDDEISAEHWLMQA